MGLSWNIYPHRLSMADRRVLFAPARPVKRLLHTFTTKPNPKRFGRVPACLFIFITESFVWPFAVAGPFLCRVSMVNGEGHPFHYKQKAWRKKL